MAPPAGRVHGLMTDLMNWLAITDEHPIVASSFLIWCSPIRRLNGYAAPEKSDPVILLLK